MLALEGIKVLDFCRNTPGMFCTMVLGDLGADVLMVERPMTGDWAEYEESLFGVKTWRTNSAAPPTTLYSGTSKASP
jgi:crotonobetainyl-CoA:carnitine CoA-transferase CaiB-like acyl-CoA transferase